MKKVLIILTFILLTTTGCFAREINTEAMLQYNQGIDYYKTGQYDNAIESFKNAIRIDPNYIDAYYNLGSILEYLQQYDAALPIFKQIIVRKPDDYDSVYKAAWLSYKLGEFSKAKTYLGIIPKNCARAADAQTLARQIAIEMPEYKEETSAVTAAPPTQIQTPAPKVKTVNQTNGIYNNIAAPTGITSDKNGNLYIAEYNNNAILKITPENKEIVYVKDAKISGPIGLAADGSNNIYIANYNKDNVLKVSSLGEISVLISNVKKPYCLYVNGKMLFISCQGSNSVLRYRLP